MSAKVTLTVDDAGWKHDFALATQFANERLKEMAREAKTQTKTAATEVTNATGSMRAATERAASIMGGAFGDVADIVFDLGEKVTSAGGGVGSLGAIAGGAVVGVAALGYAAAQLADYAEEAAQRLEEAGHAARIPSEAQDSLDRYREGTSTLRTETDLLAVSLSGPLFDAIGDLSFAMSGLLARMDEARTAVTGVVGAGTDAAETLLRVTKRFGTFGVTDVIDLVNGAIEAKITVGERLGEILETEEEMAKKGTEYAEREAKARAAAAEDLGKAVVDAAEKASDEQLKHAQKLGDQIVREAEEAERKKLAAQKAAYEKANAEAVAAARKRAQMLADLEAEMQAEADAEAQRTRDYYNNENDKALKIAASVAELGPAAAPLGSLDTSGSAGAISGGSGGIVGGALKGLSAAGGDGVMVALATTGPVGAAIATLVSLPGIFDGLLNTVDELVGTFTELPSEIGRTLTETIPDILGGLGDLVTSIVGAALDLPGILMDAVPELVSSIVQVIPNLIGDLVTMFAEKLPQMFADGIEFLLSGGLYGAIASGVWDALNEVLNDLPQKIADKLGEALSDLLTPFKDKEGRVLGTDFTAEGGRSLFGWDLPSFDRGTSEITRTGLSMVHRGEEITRASQAGRGRLSAAPVTINVHGGDVREIVRQLREHLGGDYGPTFGLGESLP